MKVIISSFLALVLFFSGCVNESQNFDLDNQSSYDSTTTSSTPKKTSHDPITTTLNPTTTTGALINPDLSRNYSDLGCMDECLGYGFDGGQCDWDDFGKRSSEWAKDVQNIGKCLLSPDNNHCGSYGCTCQCFNEVESTPRKTTTSNIPTTTSRELYNPYSEFAKPKLPDAPKIYPPTTTLEYPTKLHTFDGLPRCEVGERIFIMDVDDTAMNSYEPRRAVQNRNPLSASAYSIIPVEQNNRAYLKFDLSKIPPNVEILDASLWLYGYHIFNGTKTPGELISIHHVYNDSWTGVVTEYLNSNEWVQWPTLNWENQPCGVGFDDGGQCDLQEEVTILARNEGWYSPTITRMLTKDYLAGERYLSIAVKAKQEAKRGVNYHLGMDFPSRFGAQYGTAPFIKVCYTSSYN